MLRTAVLGLLVVWPLVSRADVGVGLRKVTVQVTLTVEREYPDFAIFVIEHEPTRPQRVAPTPASPLILRSEDKGADPFVVDVYVVPKTELTRFGQAIPPASWFEQPDHYKYSAGVIGVRTYLDVFDNRERIERTYLIRSAGDDFQLELVTENRGKPRRAMWAWGAVCCGLPLLGVAVAGWLALRLSKRKSRSRH